jgi:hypothetical protein
LFPVTSFLVTISLTLLVNRIGTVALTLTGLSHESARFQARSALTGVGYTTTESESCTQHPVRRRIVMMLMLLGNAGFVTMAASLMGSFTNTESTYQLYEKLGLILGGVVLLGLFSRSQFIDQHLSRLIAWSLKKWTHLDVIDYTSILQLSKGYAVTELLVEAENWLADKTLIDLELTAEGILVLGIQRAGGRFDGAPAGNSLVEPRDTLIIYGRLDQLNELRGRPGGEEGRLAHEEAVRRHREK